MKLKFNKETIYQVCLIQLNSADQNENLNYHLLKAQPLPVVQYYPYRFYRSFLSSNDQYENQFIPAAQLEDNSPVEYVHEYNHDLNHRHAFREDPLNIESSNKAPYEKEYIELNTLDDDEASYTDLDDAQNDENGLINYKEKANFKYVISPLDNNLFKKDTLMAMDGAEFSYDDQKNWPGACSNTNAKQSPIFLSSKDSIVDSRSKLDIGVRYAQNIPVTELENNGHSVQFEIPKSVGDLTITGPALNFEVYKAAAIHFHWGENNTVGSEHVINSVRFPLEMHIVHFNTKYKSLDEALKHKDGTTVLGVMFKIGHSNKAMEPLIRKLNKVHCKGQKANIKDINVLRLLPSKVRRIYQYYGSLTTPPCTATINWIVIETPSLISAEQMAKFRHLTQDESCQTPLKRNYRDLQDIKNRHVKRSVKL